MSHRTPDEDVDVPGAHRRDADRKTEGHLLHRKGAKPNAGLFLTNKYDLVNNSDSDGDDDEEEKNADEESQKGPLIDDHSANLGCGILNTIFGMLLVVAMCLPGTEGGAKILVVIFIGALMALTSSVAFVYFALCHMNATHFQDQIAIHIEEKKEKDPEFAKDMKRVWLVNEKKYVADIDEYLNAQQEGLEEGEDKDLKLGGASFQSDGEDIVDDDEGTQTGENSPRETAGSATYASLPSPHSQRDPKREPSPSPDTGIEMTKIIIPSEPVTVPKLDEHLDGPKKPSILKKQDSQPRQSRNVSFAGKGNLFQNPAQAEEMQKLADLAEINEDRAFAAGEESNDETDEPSKQRSLSEQAPDNFYEILFSAAHLKVTFRKFKNDLKAKVPNGYDLDGMDEKELSDIISSKPTRKRILAEASKLATKMKTDDKRRNPLNRTPKSAIYSPANDSDDSDDIGDFLGAPADLSDDEEVLS